MVAEKTDNNTVRYIRGYELISSDSEAANIVAICFYQIDSRELMNISNAIIEFIDVDVRFGDSIEVINHLYGDADFTDVLYEDMIRYNYIISPQLLMVFGLKNDKLSYLDIVNDENKARTVLPLSDRKAQPL